MAGECKLLFFVFFTAVSVNLQASHPYLPGNSSALNTAARCPYLNDFEKEVIFEINLFRSDPANYSREYIEPLRKFYKGNLFYYPGDKPLSTREGVSALNECVSFLKTQKPAGILSPEAGLSLAARDLVDDQSGNGGTGHQGSDRSGFRDRIERHGLWGGRIAENITYGEISPRQVVIYLLIDDGIRERGHRKNFLNPGFSEIGVASGNHPQYGNMCVMEFAGDFRDFSTN